MMQPLEAWQDLYPPKSFADDCGHESFYPATLGDGRQIRLPIRPLAGQREALASLIVNQAGFAVLDALADDLAARLAPAAPDLVVGLPTLGLTLAAEVARRLGHDRYVPLGTSRKFWYDDGLSVPLSSVTTPQQAKRLYIDPRMVALMTHRRIALIDDVISSGKSNRAALALLQCLDLRPVAIGAAMLQSDRWRLSPSHPYPGWTRQVHACFSTPILRKGVDGLWYDPVDLPAN